MINNNWNDRGALPINMQPQQQATPQEAAKPKRSGWMSFLPMATGIVGGVAGSFLAPGVGTAAGGAGGAALGEWLAQKLSGEADDGIDKGNLLEEGAFGALGGLGKAFKAGKAATTAARAGKGADALDILRKGAPAAKGLTKAMPGATSGGARGWLSSKLLQGADDTALRASQLSGKKEALKGFEKRFGEDLGTYLRKNNLIGKTGKDVEETLIKDLGEKYGKEVAKINRGISSSDVLVQNQKQLEKLLNSASTDNKRLGDEVFKELDAIFKKEGGAIDPKRLNEIKSEYQQLAKNAYKLGNNSNASVNEKVAQYLKKTLQGVSGSDELARTGKELDKAFKASDLLASAAQNGRGTLSLGLTDLLAAGGGASIGSLPGAVAAVGAKKAINSPKTQAFIANKLASTGEKLAGGAVKAGAEKVVDNSVKGTVKGMVKAQAIPRSLQLMAGAPGETGMPQDGAPQQYGAFDSAGADQDQANLIAMLTGGAGGEMGSATGYSKADAMADIKRDPKNMDKYIAMYEFANSGNEDQLSLSDSAIGRTTDAQKALQGLDELDAILQQGYAGGKIAGNLRKLNPLDTTFQTQQASIDRIRQIVGKALEGGVLRKEDEEKYKKILPTMQDEPAVYEAKVAQLRQMIGTDMQQYLQLQQGYGKGAGQVGGTDLQALLGVQ